MHHFDGPPSAFLMHLGFCPSPASLRHLGAAGQDVPGQGVLDNFRNTEGGHKSLKGVCLGRVQKWGSKPGAGL